MLLLGKSQKKHPGELLPTLQDLPLHPLNTALDKSYINLLMYIKQIICGQAEQKPYSMLATRHADYIQNKENAIVTMNVSDHHGVLLRIR